jgi:hypothetical protein
MEVVSLQLRSKYGTIVPNLFSTDHSQCWCTFHIWFLVVDIPRAIFPLPNHDSPTSQKRYQPLLNHTQSSQTFLKKVMLTLKSSDSKKSELGKRAEIFVCCGHLGSMAGGWVQAGLLESLAGNNRLPAWRWIFIIVGTLTISTAIFGKFSSESAI